MSSFIKTWPGRIGWYATVEKLVVGSITTELEQPWWRPTEGWARKPALRYLKRERARDARRAASKREPV